MQILTAQHLADALSTLAHEDTLNSPYLDLDLGLEHVVVDGQINLYFLAELLNGAIEDES